MVTFRLRTACAMAMAAGAVLACAPQASAHGIQGRADLPVPIIAFYWASAVVLVVSFVGLAAAWHRPLLSDALARRTRQLTPWPWLRRLVGTARILSVLVFGLVVATALFGSADLNHNLAPIAVFVVWWIGIAVCAATVGDAWRLLHPAAALARWVGMPSHTDHPYRWGMWPAFFALALFTWLELVYPTAADVRLLGALIIVWLGWTVWGMSRYGIETWMDQGEPFSAYTNLLSGLAIIGRRDGGGVELRPPVLGVTRTVPRAGLVPFAGLLIGSVSFDGLSRTLWWKQRVADMSIGFVDRGLEALAAQRIMGTIGLVVMIGLAIGAFLLASGAARRLGRMQGDTRHGALAQAFAPSLVPIAVAYVVAHYFSFFWFQSQSIIRLASDPFGEGWNLLGTAGFEVSYSTLSANAIWLVQVGAIVVGHVLGLMLAHDRALEIAQHDDNARAVRSQWAMLALMVLYTIGGLYFLSEGLNG